MIRPHLLSIGLLLAALLIATPACAEEDSTVFGNAACGTYSCSQFTGLDGSSPQIASLVASATACIAHRLGYHGGEAFDASYGLDSNNCLHANSVEKAKQGFTIAPSCCLVPTDGDNCRLSCQFIGTKE